MRSNVVPPDALREALGQVIADQRREWRRERELIEAESRAAIAELRARVVELEAAAKETIDRRLSVVRDGDPGVPGAGVAGVRLTETRRLVFDLTDGRSLDVGDVPLPEPPDLAVVQKIVDDAVKVAVDGLPPPKDGQRGLDADPELIKTLVSKAVDGIQVGIGPDEVDAIVQRALDALPKPPETPTKETLSAEIEAAAARIIATIPAAEKGESGTGVTLDDVAPLIEAEIARRVAEIPAAKDGLGLANALIDRDGQLIVTMTDGSTKALGVIVGRDGADADPAAVEALVRAEVAKIPAPEPAKSVAADDVRPMLEEMVAALPKPEPGRSVTVDDVAPLIVAEVARAVAKIPPPERGKEGPPGKLPVIVEWSDGVHYEGACVTHGGTTYQAQRDTGRSPPHEDWRCIAAAGQNGVDGRSFVIRGTFDEAADYQELNVVTLGGASFVARQDAPGACPGAGWQLIASQGKRGHQGESGKGLKGDPGKVGAPLVSAAVDDEGVLTLTNGDGSVVSCDFYPVLTRAARRCSS